MALKIGIEADVSQAKDSLDDLMKALMQTGQAGTALADIKIDQKQFSAAAEQLKFLKMEYESWKKTAEGDITVKRAAKFGQKADAPMKWDWESMYASKGAAEKARSSFWFRMTGQEAAVAGQAPPIHPMVPAERPVAGQVAANWFTDSGERMATGWNRGAGGTGIAPLIIGGVGTLAGGAAGVAGSLMGGPLAGIAATLGVGLVAKKAVEIGAAEHKAALPEFERVYQKMANTRSWDDLTAKIRQLGSELHLTSKEAASLTHMFMSVAGAADIGVAERVAFAGRFGRGFGMAPAEAAQGFAQAEYLGIGAGNKAEQREFAMVLAETISAGGMYAKSEQVMNDLLGYIKTSESRTGNVTRVEELQRYAEIRGLTYMNPATRGPVGESIIQSAQGLLKGGDPVRESQLWRTFGEEIGGDPFAMEYIRHANQFQTVYEATGVGSDKKTLFDLSVERARRDAISAYGEGGTPEEIRRREAVYLSRYTGGSPQQAEILLDLQKSFGEGGFGKFNAWAEKRGIDLEKVDPMAFRPLSQLYEGKGDLGAMAEKYISAEETSDKDRKALRANYDVATRTANDEELRKILPGIIAAGSPMTPAERDEKISADFKNALEEHVGKPVVSLTREVKIALMAQVGEITSLVETMKTMAGLGSAPAKSSAPAIILKESMLAGEKSAEFINEKYESFKKIMGSKDEFMKFFNIERKRKLPPPKEEDLDSLTRQLPPSSPKLSKPLATRASNVFDFFVDKGFESHHAAAITGNLIQESQLNTEAVGDSGKAIGIAQWQGSRQPPLGQRDFESQLEHVLNELRSTERKALDALLATDDVKEATRVFSKKFLRPGKPMMGRRIAYSEDVMRTNAAKSSSVKSASQAPSPSASVPGSFGTTSSLSEINKSSAPALPETSPNSGAQKAGHINIDGAVMDPAYKIPDFIAPQIPADAEAAVRYNTIPSITDARLGGQIDVNVQQVDHLGRRIRQLGKQAFRPEPKLAGTVDVGLLSGSSYYPGTLGVG